MTLGIVKTVEDEEIRNQYGYPDEYFYSDCYRNSNGNQNQHPNPNAIG